LKPQKIITEEVTESVDLDKIDTTHIDALTKEIEFKH
jgi:hypothetical protein